MIGQGVINSPICTAEYPKRLCRKNGIETKASICPQNEAIEVAIESANTGMRNRSTGRSGERECVWR